MTAQALPLLAALALAAGLSGCSWLACNVIGGPGPGGAACVGRTLEKEREARESCVAMDLATKGCLDRAAADDLERASDAAAKKTSRDLCREGKVPKELRALECGE